MILKGERITRKKLLAYLKGHEISQLCVRAEHNEVAPVDGFRRYEATGRVFFDLVADKRKQMSGAHAEFTIKGDVERLTLGPDDILVFTADVRSPAEFEAFTQEVKRVARKMGLGERYLILSKDVTLGLVSSKA